jgi:uncharacterized membrane protein YdbT with pleckstrin-like domain
MGYPEKLLSDDEVIASEFRPHWLGIIREGLVLLVALVAVALLVANDAPAWLSVAVLLLALILVTRGLTRWFTTLHVITNERVIYRAGLIAKRGKEIPLEVVNDVAFNQTIIERIFGTGDLLIESAGTHGQSRYKDIPGPEAVQSLIYEQRETRMAAMRNHGGEDTESAASQLSTLSRLHDEGKLSDEEFDTEKRKLLGGN